MPPLRVESSLLAWCKSGHYRTIISPWGRCGITYFWRLVSLYEGGTSHLAKYIWQQNDDGGIRRGPIYAHPDAQMSSNTSYIIAGERGKWVHNSLLSHWGHQYRVKLGDFSVLIFWHDLGRGVMNKAYDNEITHPITTDILMACLDSGGTWGMHVLVHKWGEIVVFILHFFTLSHTKTSFVAYFQCLDKI